MYPVARREPALPGGNFYCMLKWPRDRIRVYVLYSVPDADIFSPSNIRDVMWIYGLQNYMKY